MKYGIKKSLKKIPTKTVTAWKTITQFSVLPDQLPRRKLKKSIVNLPNGITLIRTPPTRIVWSFSKRSWQQYEILSDTGKRAACDLKQKELSDPAPQTKHNDLLTEAFRSAGMWAGFGLWIVSKLEKKINKE